MESRKLKDVKKIMKWMSSQAMEGEERNKYKAG